MRSIATVLLVCAVGSGVATAKPLPTGMKVTLAKKKVVVSKDGVSVPLGVSMEVDKLGSAELSEDGKSIAVKLTICEEADEEPRLYPLAEVEAKIANAVGMKFHVKKKYDDAIKAFSEAVKKDPATPVYVTNLLSAQSMGNKLEDADATLAAHGKRIAPWLAWRLAVDKELTALVARPSANVAAAQKPGTATSKLEGKIAVSPLGFAASEVDSAIYDGMPSGDRELQLAIVDLATGKEVLRLPTESVCGPIDPMAEKPKFDPKCVKKAKAAADKNRKVADAVLAKLGFELVPKAYVDVGDGNAVKAPDGRTFDPGEGKITAGKTTKTLETSGRFIGVGWLPKAVVGLYIDKTVTDCTGEGVKVVYLTATPTP